MKSEQMRRENQAILINQRLLLPIVSVGLFNYLKRFFDDVIQVDKWK